jgi:hypothetical protein
MVEPPITTGALLRNDVISWENTDTIYAPDKTNLGLQVTHLNHFSLVQEALLHYTVAILSLLMPLHQEGDGMSSGVYANLNELTCVCSFKS